MTTVAVDLYNHYNDWIMDHIQKKYLVVSVMSAPYFADYCKLDFVKNIDMVYKDSSICFDLVIVLNDEIITVNVAKARVEKHLKNKKHVLCFYLRFSSEEKDYLKQISLENEVSLTFVDLPQVAQPKSLENIDVPVIFVSSMGINCDKTCTALKVKEYFSNKKEKVLLITNNEYNCMFGGMSIEQLLSTSNVCEVINTINSFVNERIIEDNYSMIIVVVPMGILAYDEKITNCFGILNYILMQALHPDLCMFNLYFKNYSIEEITLVQKMVSNVMGNVQTILGLSHLYFDMYNYSLDKKNVNYIIAEQDIYQKIMTTMHKKGLYLYDTRDDYSINEVLNNVKQ